jgi:hypothetical protein
MGFVMQSPTPTVGLDKTLTFNVLQGSHDGHTREGTALNAGYHQLIVGHTNADNYNWRSFALLTAETIGAIPQGATIKTADLVLVQDNNRTNSPDFKLTFELADNPALPTGSANLVAKARTSFTTPSYPGPYVDGQAVSIDMKAQLQTLVNRSGWQSNKVQLFLDPMYEGYQGDNTFCAFYSYDGLPANAPKLVVTW